MTNFDHIYDPSTTLTTEFVTIATGKPVCSAIPANPTCIVDFLAFANKSISDVQVWVIDGTGKTLLPGVTMPAGGLTVIPIPEGGLRFSDGLQWRASVGGAIDAWARLIVDDASCGLF